jgi:hypothetical protein
MESAGDRGYRIVSRMSGKCIGTDGENAAAGSHIVQSQCGNSPRQLWTREKASDGFAFKNVGNRQCLDVPGASLVNGARLIAWVCNSGVNQTWRYLSPTTP